MGNGISFAFAHECQFIITTVLRFLFIFLVFECQIRSDHIA